MASFIRSIPKNECINHIREILSRSNHYIPLKFVPRCAMPGDFVYLAYCGRLIGRVRISEIKTVNSDTRIGSTKEIFNAKCFIMYKGPWQKPPREIVYRGVQGIRYLKRLGLSALDYEKW